MESDGQGFGEHRFDEHGHGEHQEHHGHEGHREHDEHREHEEHREHHEHQDGQGQKHLLFVSKPSGYELIERDGEPPSVGSAVDLGDRSAARPEGRTVAPPRRPSPLRLPAGIVPQ